MPNWVKNKVTFMGAGSTKLAKRLKKLEEANGCLFDEFVPMPETYKRFDTTNYPNGERLKIGETLTPFGLIEDDSKVTVTQELIDAYKNATKEQKEKYGAVGWYQWSCLHWGTKWDVADWYFIHDNCIEFNTAWSYPDEFLLSLSKQYPKLKIAVEYADEAIGSNCGCVVYKNGKMKEIPANEMFALYMHDYSIEEIVETFIDFRRI